MLALLLTAIRVIYCCLIWTTRLSVSKTCIWPTLNPLYDCCVWFTCAPNISCSVQLGFRVLDHKKKKPLCFFFTANISDQSSVYQNADCSKPSTSIRFNTSALSDSIFLLSIVNSYMQLQSCRCQTFTSTFSITNSLQRAFFFQMNSPDAKHVHP